MRFQLPHAALAQFYGVDRPAITQAVHEIRPLLAARGFAVPGSPDQRLRTLADVFAYAAAEGVTLRVDGTEVQTIAATTTRTGLTVQAELDTGLYPTGVKVSDQQMAALPITRHHFHGD